MIDTLLQGRDIFRKIIIYMFKYVIIKYDLIKNDNFKVFHTHGLEILLKIKITENN